MLGTPKHFTVGSNFLWIWTPKPIPPGMHILDQKNKQKTRLSFALMQGKKLEATIEFFRTNDINIALHR